MAVRHVKDLHPNPYNKTLFDKSLQENDIGLVYLTEDIGREGLRHPIFCRPDGLILDGERRWRAVTMLGWHTVETIEKDVPDDEVLDYIVRAHSSSRQSTMREQARVYLTYVLHLKATTNLPPRECKFQAMQRAHFSFAEPETADMVVTVFQKGSPEIQEKLLTDRLSVVSAFNLVQTGSTRSRLHNPGQPRKKRIELLEERLAEKFADAPKDPEPGEVDVTTGLPATYADHRLDPLIDKAFELIQEPTTIPAPKPVDLDQQFDEVLHAIWVRDKPETTADRLLKAFTNVVDTVFDVDPQRAKKLVRATFPVLRPLLNKVKDA